MRKGDKDMTNDEQLSLLSALTDEKDVNLLSAFLMLAGQKICRKAYPFSYDKTEVPAQYQSLQVEIAAYMLDKRGATGEIAHSENGISWSYENGDIPDSMLADIVPYVGVI